MSEKSMRKAIEESFDGTEEEGGSTENTEESLRPTEEEDLEEKELKEGLPSLEDDDDSRDDKKEDTDEAGESISASESESEDDESSEEKETIPAPVSWTPSVRELWAKLPLDVQREVQKRETEISRGLQQASGFKKVANEYHNVIAPFESLIRARNATPAEAIHSMMSTAARLTMGTPAQKAQVVTEVIKEYGIDIEMLDSALAGEQLPDSQFAPVIQHLDQQLKPIQDFMGQYQTTEREQVHGAEQKVYDALNTFAEDPKNEFFEDVREDMADIMELNSRRGREITLQDAYDKACHDHPEISKVVSQREAAARANRAARLSDKGAGRKRHAASGLASTAPVGDGKNREDTSIRGSISAALDDYEEGAA